MSGSGAASRTAGLSTVTEESSANAPRSSASQRPARNVSRERTAVCCLHHRGAGTDAFPPAPLRTLTQKFRISGGIGFCWSLTKGCNVTGIGFDHADNAIRNRDCPTRTNPASSLLSADDGFAVYCGECQEPTRRGRNKGVCHLGGTVVIGRRRPLIRRPLLRHDLRQSYKTTGNAVKHYLGGLFFVLHPCPSAQHRQMPS